MNDFICPKCNGHLCIGKHLIFKVINSRKQNAILLLSPQIGNYTSLKHPSFQYSEGEHLDFYCPLCNNPLMSDIHENLAHVVMEDKSGNSHDVYFSQIAGEHSTYKTSGESVHAAGEDAGRYTYFKIGDKFKKYF